MKRNHTVIIIALIAATAQLQPLRESSGATDQRSLIASFSTSIAGQDDNVKSNIMIASGKLNGIAIQPNSIFSFNDAVGEGSAGNGFSPGRVLYRDSVAYEAGGGLCQVSSTLFNALLLAGCVIIERHRHSQPVSYVPLGLDATIKYGKKDLRMKNPYDRALRIECSAGDASLAVRITSDMNPPYRYEVYTEEEDIEVPFAEDESRIRKGVSVLVYRKRYRNEAFVDSALMYKDYYPPAYTR